jgi:SAM-dependent methyltransferase
MRVPVEISMTVQRKLKRAPSRQQSVATDTARAYTAAGRNYVAYADGDPSQLFAFNSRYSFADREIWCHLDAALKHMIAENRRTLRLLDAGCGPGTWTRRVALHARALGFTRVEAYGIDIAPGMLDLARSAAASIDDPAIRFHFAEHDLSNDLPFDDGAFDLTLCLYAVLNHVSPAVHARAAAALSRVTGGMLFATVRTVGSLPTIYVDCAEYARAFHQDNDANWMDVEMLDGRRLGFPSHLFTGDELRHLFEPHLTDITMQGLDLFHSRFAPNVHWNPASLERDDAFTRDLEDLERRYASDPNFINRAAHILLMGERLSNTVVRFR